MAMEPKEMKKYNYNKFSKHVRLPIPTCNRIELLSDMFRYNKTLSRSKTIQEFVWLFHLIKNTDRAIVCNNNKFEIIERRK